MTLDKELKKIDEIVRNFVQSINEEYDCEMGLDFMAQLDSDIVVWSILTLEKSGEAFYNNFVSRFPKAKGFSLFTLSVLHEVGHLETENEMEDDNDDSGLHRSERTRQNKRRRRYDACRNIYIQPCFRYCR